VNKKKSAKEKINILIVEDCSLQAEILSNLLEQQGHKVAVANDGRQALALLKENKPALVISDILMPEMTGFELCQRIKADAGTRDIPVIVLTALSDSTDVLEGLAWGADSFITKPYNKEFLLKHVAQTLEGRLRGRPESDRVEVEIPYAGRPRLLRVEPQRLVTLLISAYEAAVCRNKELVQAQNELSSLSSRLEDMVEQRTEDLNREIAERRKAEAHLQATLLGLHSALAGVIQVLSMATEKRDPYTAGHQRRVADLARAIAQELGLSPDRVEGIRVAGAIHDIGKLSIPAEILSKPTPPSKIEYALLQSHVQIGHEILSGIEFAWPIAQMVLQHHERMDGSGYPQQLKGDDILLESRILAVSDVIEAMASDRPYRPALGIEIALKEIENGKGVLYDPAVVSACLSLFREKRFALA